MRLLLVRHRQIQSNADQVIDSRIPGPRLTRLGEAQAAALLEALGAEDVGAIWVSSMVRTHRTAAPLAGAHGLTPVERHGLHEIQANHWELSRDPEHITAYYDVVLSWARGDLDRRMPGGELGQEFFARYDAVVEEAVQAARDAGAGTVALVSHGTAIRCWTARRADNLDAADLGRRPLANTGVVVLEDSGDRARPWTCRSWMGEPVGAVGAGAAAEPAAEPDS